MKKNLLKSLIALAALCLGTMNVAAENEIGTAPVKMTVVDYNQPEVAFGALDTISVGYNKAPSVGGTIGFGNIGWGVNKFGIAKADVSAFPGVVQKATLKMKVSGADDRRTTAWGVALTDNEWADTLTYNGAGSWTVSALLNGGNVVWSTSKLKAVFDEIELDVSDAFTGGQPSATFIIYQTAAGVCFMTEPVVEVEYEPYEATTTKYDFEDGVNIFTDDSRISSAVATDDVLGSQAVVFTAAGNCQNGYGFAHYDFTSLLDKPALVGVEFDYYNQNGTRAILTLGDRLVRQNDGGCSKNTYGSKGAIFRIGSTRDNFIINGYNLRLTDGTKTEKVLDEESGDSVEVTTPIYGYCDKWLHVSVLANNDTKTVSWTVTDVATGEVVHSGLEAFWQADANELSQIDVFAWINNAMSGKVDNLAITNYKSNAKFADYTIKYVDANGNELKESRPGNGQVGKFVKLLDSDKAAITVDSEKGIDGKMKYKYVSDDSETVAIAEDGSAVITVTFREAEIYAGVLNCMIAGQSGAAARLASFTTNFFEDDNAYVYPSRGYGKDGVYYFTAATSYNGVSFAFPGSLNSRTVGGVVTYIGQLDYTADESVAYYSDFERLALPVEDEGNGTGLGQLVGTVNNWWSFSNGIFDRFSQGRGIRLDADSYVWTEPIAEEGTYMVRIYGRNDKSENCTAPYALGLRDAEGNVEIFDIAVPDWSSATTGESIIGAAAVEAKEATEESEAVEAVEADGIGIKAGYSLVVMNTGNGSNISLDDIKLTKVADYAETPITTAINTVKENAQPMTGIIYNLQGQVVKSAVKGLYIQNGKKFIVK